MVEYLDNFFRLGDQIAYIAARRLSHSTLELPPDSGNRLAIRPRTGSRQIARASMCLSGAATLPNGYLHFLVVWPAAWWPFPSDRWRAGLRKRVAQQVDAKLIVWLAGIASSAAPYPVAILESLSDDLARHPRNLYPSPSLTRDDTVEIIFTSGTTAQPKGVVISHGNILADLAPLESEIAKYRRYERIFHPIRFLNLLPLSHVFGQFLGIFSRS